jgi:hypothetical protein
MSEPFSGTTFTLRFSFSRTATWAPAYFSSAAILVEAKTRP